MRFHQYINESINDKALLKAVFFVGYPGAGKTTISKLVADGSLPIKTISSDIWTEYYANTKDRTEWSDIGTSVKAHTTSNIRSDLNGLLPIFIDTTGAKISNFKKRVDILTDMGYDISMVIVSVSKNTSIERVSKRNKEIKRHVPMDFLSKAFDDINKSIPKFKSIVPNNFVIDNTDRTDDDVLKAYRKITKFFNEPLRSKKGKMLIEYMKENGHKYYYDIPEEWKLANGFPVLDGSYIRWFQR